MTYQQLKELYLSHGHKFREEDKALNIFGARSNVSQSNKFDDVIGCAWKFDGNENIFQCKATTDPGKYYLQNPMNVNGTIIIVPGQYIECYEKGLHAGKYDALRQCAKMSYVRDFNKDLELDFSLYRDVAKRRTHIFWGINGTNLHRASEWQIVQFVEKYSAGCQVVQDVKDFNFLIGLRDMSILAGYTKFDYTLFEEGYNLKYF